ncbi:MAG: hypothetical protein J1F24_02805 [Oscillospiraceae bacterium]|nr:hypothetical protein [Oscillospiraceae bacterium]
MKQLTCEMCGGTDLIKQDGAFVCQNCGMKYSVDEAKKMMIEGTVDVQGTVKVDNSAFVERYLRNAHRALDKEDWEEVEKYYNMVEQNVPDNMEAVFFSSYGKAMLSMTDSDYFKREQKFQVLNRSMSVISDYYETTTENKEEILRKIAAYINKMYSVTFVYQRQSIDLAGAIRAASGVTGSRQWCINLINSTKNTFINELKEISQKHDETFIADILNEFGSSTASTPAPIKKAPVTSQNSENCKKYALIAAICYAVYGAYSIINRIIYVVQNPDYAAITALNIIFWIATISLAVTLFMKNEKAVIVAAGVNVLLNGYYLVAYFSLWNLLTFVAYAALVVIAVLALKGNAGIKKIWFLPAVVMLLGCLIGWFSYGYFSYIFATWNSMLFSVVEIAALVFVGMWLKANTTSKQFE